MMMVVGILNACGLNNYQRKIGAINIFATLQGSEAGKCAYVLWCHRRQEVIIYLFHYSGQENHVAVENGQERQEGGESESELDLLAEVETESDSDDQDNAESAQRSVQTGATQGSDAGM